MASVTGLHPSSPVRLSAGLMAYVVFDKLTFSSRGKLWGRAKWKARVKQNLTKGGPEGGDELVAPAHLDLCHILNKQSAAVCAV